VGQIVEVVAAHPLELKELKKGLGFKSAKTAAASDNPINGALVRLTETGIGKASVKSSLSSRFGKKSGPSVIVNVGFAGALNSELECGEWVVCSTVSCFWAGSDKLNSIAADEATIQTAYAYFDDARIPFVRGQLLTVDEPCTCIEERSRFRAKSSALAVDMEAFYVAEWARDNDIPFLSVKIISDAVSDNPYDVIKKIGSSLSVRIAETMSGLILRLAELDDYQRHNPDVQPMAGVEQGS
jgi:nucleoside phosphorylase